MASVKLNLLICRATLLFFIISSIFSCSPKNKTYDFNLKVKIINPDGKALSGFAIFKDDKKIGQINSFGEWRKSLKLKNLDPFYLTLKNHQSSSPFSKKILISLKNKDSSKKTFSLNKKVTIPFSRLKVKRKNEEGLIKKLKNSFAKIHFNIETKKMSPQADLRHLNKFLLPQLQRKSKEYGLINSLNSSWQVYIEPFYETLLRKKQIKILQWIKVVSKVPYHDHKLKFVVRYHKENPRRTVNKIFSSLRSQIKYPYKIIKLRNKWFISLTKKEQKSFWKLNKSFKLEGKGGDFFLAGKLLLHKRNIIAALKPSTENPCSLQNKNHCYTYGKSKL